MEKHKRKLCLKSLTNGRALDGHMRSNMLDLPIPPKVEEKERSEVSPNQLSKESEAASASYSSSSLEEEEEKGQFYGLRENPKRSIRLVDPEFVDAGSVVLQGREGETESAKNPTRRRSKRRWKLVEHHQYLHQPQEEETKKLKFNSNQPSKAMSWAEPEQVSSISDTTTEEDVAFSLMMLSRDQWKSRVHQLDEGEEKEETDESEEYFKLSKVNRTTTRVKYRCETCNKVFKSYQALGGHRASHQKIKAYSPATTRETELAAENVGTSCSMTVKKIHECSVCFRIFSSGQALGGHKRSHVVNGQVVAITQTPVKSSRNLVDNLIDLNLPAPVDDDDGSLMLEIVNHIK